MEEIIGCGRHTSIDGLLNEFHNAAARANLSIYFGCFDQHSRFLGTDASENWTVQEFFSFAKPHFDSGKGWEFIPKPGTRKINTYYDRNNSTVPIYATFDELLSSTSFLATSRGSGTAAFDPVSKFWLITAYHLSFPIPNDLAKEFCKHISIFETNQVAKESQQSAEAAANAAAQELLAEIDTEKSQSQNGGGKKKGKGKK